ncbi:MAG: type II toxin-antitoxin system HigA family antitoxin [Crocosphaera sp.]
MTTGLKEANNYYLQLVMEFPPRPIKNDEELMATQNRVNYILDKGILQPEDREYLRVLGILIDEYEENYKPIPKLEEVELLKALIEEDNLSPQDFLEIFDNEKVVLDVLEGKRKIAPSEAEKLRKYGSLLI